MWRDPRMPGLEKLNLARGKGAEQRLGGALVCTGTSHSSEPQVSDAIGKNLRLFFKMRPDAFGCWAKWTGEAQARHF